MLNDADFIEENNSEIAPHIGSRVAEPVARRQRIANSMYELGDKFAKIAKEATNLKQAKMALDAADKAIRLALDIDDTSNRASITMADYVFIYLSGITERTQRSVVWQYYLVFCQCYSAKPLLKARFFELMEDLGFEQKKLHGEFMVIPPGRIPAALREAAKKRDLLIELTNQQIHDDDDEAGDDASTPVVYHHLMPK